MNPISGIANEPFIMIGDINYCAHTRPLSVSYMTFQFRDFIFIFLLG